MIGDIFQTKMQRSPSLLVASNQFKNQALYFTIAKVSCSQDI